MYVIYTQALACTPELSAVCASVCASVREERPMSGVFLNLSVNEELTDWLDGLPHLCLSAPGIYIPMNHISLALK